MDGEPSPQVLERLDLLSAAFSQMAVELQGLRADLGAIYGRDEKGRLLAQSGPNGEPAAVVPRRTGLDAFLGELARPEALDAALEGLTGIRPRRRGRRR